MYLLWLCKVSIHTTVPHRDLPVSLEHLAKGFVALSPAPSTIPGGIKVYKVAFFNHTAQGGQSQAQSRWNQRVPKQPCTRGFSLLYPKASRTGSVCACCPSAPTSAGETTGPAQESLSWCSWQGCPKLRNNLLLKQGLPDISISARHFHQCQTHFHQCFSLSGDLLGQPNILRPRVTPCPAHGCCTSASGSASPGI